MISAIQFSKNLNMLEATVSSPNFANIINVQIGAVALDMIERRVLRERKGATDGPWKPYSTKPTLISPYKDKGNRGSFATKGGSDKVFRELKGKKKPKRFVAKDNGEELQWFTVSTSKGNKHLALLPGGYKRIRDIEGRPTDAKDFSFTGEMWKSIHVLGTRRAADGVFITTIGSENELSNKKLSGNVDREGKEILMVNTKEHDELNNILDDIVTNLFKKAFGD